MADLAGGGRKVKRFRVAREGQTVDGRSLSRQEILEMAQSYNPATYAGRINVEHLMGFSPEPPFNAYGDILAVEAEDESGVMVLYNTISALPNLLNINSQGQKIYPSIEFYRDFAGTGKAYQVGLGLTDTPASLGTEPIKFNQQDRRPVLRTVPDQELFIMSAMPTPTQPQPQQPQPQPQQHNAQPTWGEKFRTLFAPQPTATPDADQEFKDGVYQALVSNSQTLSALGQQMQALTAQVQQLSQPQQQANPQQPTPTQPAPVQQHSATPTPNTPAPTPAPMDITQLAALLVQGQLQQQQILQSLNVTPANPAPTATGGMLGMNEY